MNPSKTHRIYEQRTLIEALRERPHVKLCTCCQDDLTWAAEDAGTYNSRSIIRHVTDRVTAIEAGAPA